MLTSLRNLEGALAEGASEPCWLLHPDSWFELPTAARRCADSGVGLQLSVCDSDGTVPLAALTLGDFQAVYETIRDWWPDLAGDGRPPSLAPTAHEQLIAELRAEGTARADRELATPNPDGAPLGLPPPEHPLLATAERAAGFWRAFLVAQPSMHVLAWALAIAERPDRLDLARAHPWLRVLLQRQLGTTWHPPLQQLLVEAYASGDRNAMVAAERDLLAPLGLAWLTTQLADTLGLHPGHTRRRPWKLPKVTTGTPAMRDAAEVTVLIPSYRHEAYITETIRSVLAQSLAEFRLLVVDDRSPDGTVAAASAIDDPRLEVRTNDQNVGLGNSVLQALATITTPYVALLNSDDVFHPQRLAKCLAALRRNPGSELVSTGLALIDQHGKRLTAANSSALFDGRNVHDWVHWYERTRPGATPPDDLFGALLERNFLATSSNLVCRTEWLRAHADALQSLKYCLDWQLFLDAAREGKLVWLPDDLVAYRLHPTNTVWFEEPKRWAYSVEVDRVAARAIRDRVAALPADSPERTEAALRVLADHLSRNTEVDWTGLYLNELIGGFRLEDHSRSSRTIAELIAGLEHLARHANDGELAVERARSFAQATKHVLRRDEVYSLQSRDQWQRERIEQDARQLRELHQRLADEHAVLITRLGELEQARAQAQQLLAANEQARAQEQQLLAANEQATQLAITLRDRLTRAVADLAARDAELANAWAELARAGVELAATKATLAATTLDLQQTHTSLDAASTALAKTAERLAGAELDLGQTARRLAATARERDQLRDEVAQESERRQARERELADAYAAMAAAERRHDVSERLLADEIASQQLRAESLQASFVRVRGTKLLLGSGLARWSRRLRKPWRKLAAMLPAEPWRWLRWRREHPLVATTLASSELRGELRSLCGEAAACLRVLTIADGNGAAPRPRTGHEQVAAWAFPEQGPSLWRHYHRRTPERGNELLASLASLGGVDEQGALAAVLPHLALCRSVERQRAALLIGHGTLANLGGMALAARLLKRPWLAVVESLDDGGGPFARWARRELAQADIVVARSAALRDALCAEGVDAAKVVVRVGPVATGNYQTPTAGVPLLVAMGRLAADAGFEQLLLAAAQLRDRGLACRVAILGEQPPHDHGAIACAARLRALTQALRLDADLQFAPSIDGEVQRRLLESRPAMFVAPSRRTALPAPLDCGVLAAMANGLPIVGSDVPAIAAAVQAGREAVLVPPEDSRALATAVAALANDAARQRDLAEHARQRFLAELQPERTRAALAERIRLLLMPVRR